MQTRTIATLTLFAASLACGGEPSTSAPQVGVSVLEVAPPGSDAAPVSNDVPLAMNPGERLNVRVTMQNTGTVDWNSSFQLRRHPNTANAFGFVSRAVVGTVTPGNSYDFYFVIIAPSTPGTYTFETRMYSAVAGQSGYFGTALPITNIVVSNATTRRWACQYEPTLSTLPATMNPGQVQSVSIVVRNVGTGTWPATNFFLRSRDDVGPSANYTLWGSAPTTVNTPLTQAVAPNGTATFTFNITAPAVAGTYSFLRQMFSNGQSAAMNPGVAFFDYTNHCVNRTVNVGVAGSVGATLVSQNFPTTMAPNETRTVTVVMQNSGTTTWVPNDFRLYYNRLPRTFWGPSNSNVTTNVATNQQHTFVFAITAPAVPGNYVHEWRMRKLTNPDLGAFGATISVPVLVDPGAAPVYDAEVVSQTIPTTMNQSAQVTFEITMRNNGTATWTGSSFELFSVNTPESLWQHVVLGALGAAESVAPGQTRTFTRVVTSPAAAGVYASRWQMRQTGPTGVGLFGDVAETLNIDVNNCGNSTVNPPETCDDGNRTAGDGCDATCMIEARTIDLATAPAGRTFIGSTANGQLANSAMGDVTNDGTSDLLMAEIANITATVGVTRIDAGRVAGYSGVGLFSGATTTLPTGASFQIWGAEAEDELGGGGAGGGLEIGDVTGDGVPDVVASAALADGPANSRLNCGQVYVFAGGAGLTGVLDLGATTPPAPLVATIVGAAAGDTARILAVGDLTNDGIDDLVIGAPGSDANGVDSGAVYIIRGGGTLTGTITLDAPGMSLVGTMIGSAAGDQLGLVAAIGDFGNSPANDLLLGSQVASPGGRTRAGAAWGLFSVTGTRNLASSFDVAWYGAEASDRLGTSVAIGDAIGTTRGDVIIGVIQANDALSVQVGAVDLWQGPIAAGTNDLSLGATATVRIQGIEANDDAGRAIQLGDFNNDGFLDIPVIASQADGPMNGRDRSGEMSIILGGTALPAFIDLESTTPALLLYGPTTLGRMGHLVQSFSVGDIDGGQDDFCIGSYLAGGAGAPGRIDCMNNVF